MFQSSFLHKNQNRHKTGNNNYLFSSKKTIFVKIEKIMNNNKKIIIRSIREILKDILPAGGKAILFGSQARNEAREDSDWDILILLDKTRIEANDYDTISYPLRELGWKFKACINPVMYTMKDWLKYSFSPFYHNVTKDGIDLI